MTLEDEEKLVAAVEIICKNIKMLTQQTREMTQAIEGNQKAIKRLFIELQKVQQKGYN